MVTKRDDDSVDSDDEQLQDPSEPEDQVAEYALLEAFIAPLVRDVRRTLDPQFSVAWFVERDSWWWSCLGTSSLWCETGDARASVSGKHRSEVLADVVEHIADNAFDVGPVWPLCPEHRNHALNAVARGNHVMWSCRRDGLTPYYELGSLPIDP
jgi:hypothetical protein